MDDDDEDAEPPGAFPADKGRGRASGAIPAHKRPTPWFPIFFGNFSSRLAEVVAVFTHPDGAAFLANLGNH
jgi:hypothetical protein